MESLSDYVKRRQQRLVRLYIDIYVRVYTYIFMYVSRFAGFITYVSSKALTSTYPIYVQGIFLSGIYIHTHVCMYVRTYIYL